jgi:MYXO-CTERM domain-containing protein
MRRASVLRTSLGWALPLLLAVVVWPRGASEPSGALPRGEILAAEGAGHAAPGVPGVGAWSAANAGGAEVLLPRGASGAARLREPVSGVAASFRLAGAIDVPATVSAGGASYEGALGPGTSLLLRRLARGLEDLVRFECKPAAEQVVYMLDTGGFAGLRKVGGVVELLDASGAPRLRVEPPSIRGADGRVALVEVEVGCAHDTSPRGPWGRAITPPGARECALTVSWADRGVTYPAVLDPAWGTTADMAFERGYPASGVLSDGRVLVTGGKICADSGCPVLDSSELFDPATGTWAVTGAMGQGRSRLASVVLPGKGVLAIGGDDTNVTTKRVELYEPATGQWTQLPGLGSPRADATATLLPDGKTVVVVGGAQTLQIPLGNVDLLDTESMTWTSGAPLAQPRFLHTTSVLPNGSLLIVGGTTCATCLFPVGPTEIYDPATDTTSKAAPPLKPRFAHTAANVLIGGSPVVLVSGGLGATSEYYDPAIKSWVKTPDMLDNRTFHRMLTLPDGSVLVAGGAELPAATALTTAERFDPSTKTWISAGTLATSRAAQAMELLGDGRVLAAGGITGIITKDDSKAVVSAEIFAPLAAATPCALPGECASLHCVEGVCCDTACDAECSSCRSTKKGGGAEGVCGPVAANTDPDGECLDAPVSACATTGVCDGAGKCARNEVGTVCGTTACADGAASVFTCVSDGKCEPKVTPCAPYACKDPTVCATSCSGDEQCDAAAHCVLATKKCEPNKASGAPCAKAAECSSHACVDGVCCATSCDGACQACAAATKASGDKSGVCGPAKAGTDPHDDCGDEPVSSCDRNGLCDGKGQCALFAAGTKCLEADCTGSAQSELKVTAYACDGSGTCLPSAGVSCGLYGCEQGACRTACEGATGCVAHAYCSAGACLPKKALGAACSGAAECDEGFCVDGVCCNTPCDKPCEACDSPKAAGLCVPVPGAPHNARPACPAAAPDAPCKQRTCDGIERATCEGYVGPATSCRAAACADGVATDAATCDGKGNCPELAQHKCEPFVCGGAACSVGCVDDSGCSAKFQCDVARGDCVPRIGASCGDEHILTTPDGKTTDCAPYKCSGTLCKTSCSSVLDCVLPSVCDAATATCIPPSANPTFEGGCSTSGAGAPPALGGLGLAALSLAAALGRRRRRRRWTRSRRAS